MIDLGSSMPSNTYLSPEDLNRPEKWYPLRVLVCEKCWLVQTEDFAEANELFTRDYAYFSSFSSSWLTHSQRYVEAMVERFGLNELSHVVEVAANDGYLLQYVKSRGIPCTGIEPTASTASAARAKDISIVERFFGVELAEELARAGKHADIMVANNVLAHVPDINNFVRGFSVLLKRDGVATFEFPHIVNLISKNQFDTIYHEHFSYLSLTTVKHIFDANGLNIFDAHVLPTHGGSLRVFAQRSDTKKHRTTSDLLAILEKESKSGVQSLTYYAGLQGKANQIKNDLLSFLISAQKDGKKVVAYGAAAKGNTLLNYAGIRADLVPFVADRSPAKQGKYLPGSRIPIVDESFITATKPNYVLILPWNLSEEIVDQLKYIRSWNASFVQAIPQLSVL